MYIVQLDFQFYSTYGSIYISERLVFRSELKHILRKTQQFFDEQESLEQGGAVGQHQQLIQVLPSVLSLSVELWDSESYDDVNPL